MEHVDQPLVIDLTELGAINLFLLSTLSHMFMHRHETTHLLAFTTHRLAFYGSSTGIHNSSTGILRLQLFGWNGKSTLVAHVSVLCPKQSMLCYRINSRKFGLTGLKGSHTADFRRLNTFTSPRPLVPPVTYISRVVKVLKSKLARSRLGL